MPLASQPRAEPRDRIERPCGFDVGIVAVTPGVVGRGVRADPVRERFDQGRAFAGVRALGGLLRGSVHREHVVAVDPDAREPVALRAFPDLPGGLVRGGHADRPAVVLTEQDHGGGEDAREVGALVEIALAGAAVAEVGDRTRARAVELQPIA